MSRPRPRPRPDAIQARVRAVLERLALSFAIIGVAVLVWPVRMPSGSAAIIPTPGGSPDAGVPTVDPTVAATIVSANIFAASRKPPAARYVPSRDETPPGIVADAGAVMPSDTAAAPVGDPVPHLYGTIMGQGGPQALLRLESSVPDPRLYREGDRAGGYRVDAISERAVTLTGPRGRVVLRLTSPEARPR